MDCCIDVPRIFIDCEPPEKKVEKDLKNIQDRHGIDLTKYRDSFLTHCHHYVIEGFPRLIGSSKHTQYDLAIYLDRSHSYSNAFVINTYRKSFRMINREQHRKYADQWLVEAEAEKEEQEKNSLRERLRSVGVDVQW